MAHDLLNKLPQYSPWPSRLLGVDPWKSKKKSPSEVSREFEDEKWGSLWNTVSSSSSPVRLDDVEKVIFDDSKQLMCWSHGDLQLMPAMQARKEQFERISSTIKSLRSDNAIVELGAGYGQIILNLANDPDFEGAQLIAAEYTQSGVKLIDHFARSLNKKLTTARCDLSATPIVEIEIPEQSIIFTSYAACYLPKQNLFIDNILALKPAAVIHFEPFFEHCDGQTLLGVMQQSYILKNDYNQNLMSLLHGENSKGKIDIITEDRQVFGMNPLLPMSIVVWRPSC